MGGAKSEDQDPNTAGLIREVRLGCDPGASFLGSTSARVHLGPRNESFEPNQAQNDRPRLQSPGSNKRTQSPSRKILDLELSKK